MPETAVLRTYRGEANTYIDLASRGPETLGLGIRYQIAAGAGGFVLRFVVRSDTTTFQPFTRFVLRDHAKFRYLKDNGNDIYQAVGDTFMGARLNKLGIPVFTPAPVTMTDLETLTDLHKVWFTVADWITQQVQAEGFTLLTDNLPALLRQQVLGKTIDPATVTLVLAFPDLVAYQVKATKVTSLKKVADPDDDEDDDEDDDPDTIN